MRSVLASVHRPILAQMAWSNVLLGFDFDGTLAPIATDPERASMRSSTRALLARLARLYPCAVFSGRSIADLRRRLDGIGLRAIVGNHGLEPTHATKELRRTVASWRASLARELESLQGVVLEDKVYSLAVHYRRSRRKKQARTAILRSSAALGDVRLIGGKQVVNVLPRGAPHKGVALERERERQGCDTAFFVGDDETDEDVFALEHPGSLLTVRVGHSRTSRASFGLKSQAHIDSLLEVLIALRAREQGRLRRVAP